MNIFSNIKISKLGLLIIILVLSSCETVLFESDPSNSPKEIFNYLWEQADEKYSFFEYKNIDWDSIYDVYDAKIDTGMTDEELFDTLALMLNELKDAHVNLFSPFNISRYSMVFQDSPPNFNYDVLRRNYLGEDYMITGSLINQIFIINSKKIGYIYYGSFSYSIDEDDMDYVLTRFKDVDGIIIDVRDNGGGDPANVFVFASRFTDKPVHVYSSKLKNGPDHNDFTSPTKIYLEPQESVTFTKPIVLLTNRSSYSATNIFTAIMSSLPQCTHVGDTSGGGGGVPIGGELPNGWTYRFSATQTLLPNGFNIESGIPPDIAVWNSANDEAAGVDSILEVAFKQF